MLRNARFFHNVFVSVTFMMASNSGFDMYYMEQQMHPNELCKKCTDMLSTDFGKKTSMETAVSAVTNRTCSLTQ